MYGPVAAEHLKTPRNLGKLEDAHGVGTVEDPESETVLTIYLKLRAEPGGRLVVGTARFRAFGCGGCIVTGSIATELATGRPVEALAELDAAALLRALADGLPPEQRYCADLAARALLQAGSAASRSYFSTG